ncbi:hypothetical protein BV25DRAFT_1762843, partial [Artomyces pyxidatus]
PAVVLQDSADDDVCWSFSGSFGSFGFTLSTPIIPTEVVLQTQVHVSSSSKLQAPRTVVVWGLLDGIENIIKLQRFTSELMLVKARVPSFPIQGRGTFIPLAHFEFHSDTPSQTFPVFEEVIHWGLDWGVIVFDIRSNWGASSTSLCQVRVHG